MRLALPTPAEVAAQTPPDRDRAIDVIRIGALLGVVVGHTVMATSIIADDVLHWDNLLTTSVVFQAATWVFQIMPLFFFAGAAASMASWRSDVSWGQLADEALRQAFPARLLLPDVLGCGADRAALSSWDRTSTTRWPVSRRSCSWFLGAYVLMLAAMPLLSRVTTAGPLVAAVTLVYLARGGRRRHPAHRPRLAGTGLCEPGGVADPRHVRGGLPAGAAAARDSPERRRWRCWPPTSHWWRSGPTN